TEDGDPMFCFCHGLEYGWLKMVWSISRRGDSRIALFGSCAISVRVWCQIREGRFVNRPYGRADLLRDFQQQLVELAHVGRRVLQLAAFSQLRLIEQDFDQVGETILVWLAFQLDDQRMLG